MVSLVLNGADIIIRGIQIGGELQSSHPVKVKVQNIAWHSFVIAIDGTLIIADPAGLSSIVATNLSAAVSMVEGVAVARKIVNNPQSPTGAKVIAHCQLLCQVAFLTGTLSKIIGKQWVGNAITDPSYQLGRVANEVQNFYQKHGQKMHGLYRGFKEKTNGIWNRVFGTTLFTLSPEQQALQATDRLMENQEGRARLKEYLKANFFPLPQIFREWYRDLYKNEKGLSSHLSNRPVITPCRVRENSEISDQLFDLEELDTGTTRLGVIENNRVISQGDGKVFLDQTMLKYIYHDAIAPLRKMVTQKLEAFRE